MIPLYNTSQIRNLDSFAIKRLKVSGTVLMENAAIGIYESILERVNNIKCVGIICGKGNNGGDGYAVARHFSNAGFNVKVISLGSEKVMSADCNVNYSILTNLSNHRKNIKLKTYQTIKDINWFKDCNVIVDAILGSGFTGELKELYLSIVKSLNKLTAYKCAIDVPTGLNADTGFGDLIFNSDLTVTLGEFKKGLFITNGYEYCGQVVLKEIGIGTDYFDSITPDNYLVEPEDVFTNLPKRGKSVHKYSAGKVLTIAGSYKYPGAAVLTSKSALIAGAGASMLAIPDKVKKLIQKNLLEVVVEPYGNDKTKYFDNTGLKSLQEKIKWADVVAIGPGLGREEETINAIQNILLKQGFKLAVLDADALFALDETFLKKVNLKNCILTPHLAEFSNMIGIETELIKKDILKYGREFAIKFKCVLVLKGAPTIIFNQTGEAFVNTTGNSGMAKFGSGDVLTGIIAGLLSQNKNLETSAIAGVYLHSLSADLLLNEKSISNYLASDIMNNYSFAVKFLEDSIV
ncbi:MAG: NAD(P)H-hydrate dehydratase [Ignavibacteriales bacterium]|nr:NAD(P)H-hydrate dehydratase [Ignavibacteriales bacterium]